MPGEFAACSLNTDVVKNSVVMRWAAISRARAGPDSSTSLDTVTSFAPLSSAPQISKVAASNELFDAWATTSSGPS